MSEPKHQSPPIQEHHVFLIDDVEGGVFSLEAATYSIGRDASNAIVLNDDSVSRQHAMLIRMPIPGENRYCYRLVDGNVGGAPSRNGTFVNGEPCQSKILSKGDSIQLGIGTFCTYLIVTSEDDSSDSFLESAQYQSIKAGLTDPKETISADSWSSIF